MQENSLKQEMIRKIRIYPFWCPCQKRPFIHLISCTDDCQITPISLENVESTLTNFEKFHPPQKKSPLNVY